MAGVERLEGEDHLARVNGAAANNLTRVRAGDVLRCRVTVRNTGTGPGSTTLTERIPAHTTYSGSEGWACTPTPASPSTCVFTLAHVPAGGSRTLHFTVTVARSLPDTAHSITNMLSTSDGTCDVCTVANPIARPPVPPPPPPPYQPMANISLTKTGPATLVVGSNATYTFRVSNAGPDVAQGPLTVVDYLPAGLTFVSSRGAGWSCVVRRDGPVVCTNPNDLDVRQSAPVLRVTVHVATAVRGPVVNRARVTSRTRDPSPMNNAAATPPIAVVRPPAPPTTVPPTTTTTAPPTTTTTVPRTTTTTTVPRTTTTTVPQTTTTTTTVPRTTTTTVPPTTTTTRPKVPPVHVVTGYGLWGPGGPTGTQLALAALALLAAGLGLLGLRRRGRKTAR